MLSIEEYRRLKQLERKALFVEEVADADREAISRTEVPVEHDHLNAEFEGYVTFQLAEVAISRALFAEILRLIDRMRPAPLPP